MAAELARAVDIATAGQNSPVDVLCISTVGYLRSGGTDISDNPAEAAVSLLLQQFIDPIQKFELEL